MGGFHAFLGEHDGSLKRTSSLVLGLDTLGCGTPIIAWGEGAIATHRYRDADLALADEGAALAGEPAAERWRIGAWTDPLLALNRGIRRSRCCRSVPATTPITTTRRIFPSTSTGRRWRVARASPTGRCARSTAGPVTYQPAVPEAPLNGPAMSCVIQPP